MQRRMKTASLQEVKEAYNKLRSPFLSLNEILTFLKFECFFDGSNFKFPVSGATFLGPAQFNLVTWNEVRKIKGFPESFSLVGDVFTSLKFADAYAAINAQRFRAVARAKGNHKLTKAHFGGVLAYLCHQQGASGAVSTLLTGRIRGKQSQASLQAFAALRNNLLTAGLV